jgi:hypothetical protein
VHESLDRCAAYIASRGALAALHRAAADWPHELAEHARAAALATVTATAAALGHPHASAARRRALRDAIVAAVRLAAACDVAGALGLACDPALDAAQRASSRAVSLLAMLLHASAHGVDQRADQ